MRALEQIAEYLLGRNRLSIDEIEELRKLGILAEPSYGDYEETGPDDGDIQRVGDDAQDDIYDNFDQHSRKGRRNRGADSAGRQIRRKRRDVLRELLDRLPQPPANEPHNTPLIQLANCFTPCKTPREAIDILIRQPGNVIQEKLQELVSESY